MWRWKVRVSEAMCFTVLREAISCVTIVFDSFLFVPYETFYKCHSNYKMVEILFRKVMKIFSNIAVSRTFQTLNCMFVHSKPYRWEVSKYNLIKQKEDIMLTCFSLSNKAGIFGSLSTHILANVDIRFIREVFITPSNQAELSTANMWPSFYLRHDKIHHV